MRVCNRIDQLPCDANFPRRLPHRPLEDIAHAEPSPDFLESTARPLKVKLELRAITNSDLKRDSAVMMSSTIPSAKYSCSGSELRLVKGRTAIEGLSGKGRAGFGCCAGVSLTVTLAGPFASRTGPTKRKPLRGN